MSEEVIPFKKPSSPPSTYHLLGMLTHLDSKKGTPEISSISVDDKELNVKYVFKGELYRTLGGELQRLPDPESLSYSELKEMILDIHENPKKYKAVFARTELPPFFDEMEEEGIIDETVSCTPSNNPYLNEFIKREHSAKR